MKNVLIILILLIAIVLPTPSIAGNESGGGGDDVALDFQSSFIKAISHIKKINNSHLKKVLSYNFKKELPNLQVITVETPLDVLSNGVIQESTAMNYPANQLIKINRDRWKAIENRHIKEGLALHEMLSLIGLESTGKYPYSSEYLAHFNIPVASLNAVNTKQESKHYQDFENNIFSIEAKIRNITDPSLSKSQNNVKLDYIIKKNGLVLPPNVSGGSIFFCSYPSENSLDNKQSYVQILYSGNTPIGFLIFGQSACGNTVSKKFQLIVPSNNYFETTEIESKSDPIVKNNGNEVQAWYLTQEWGTGGTATSFFVPRMVALNMTSSHKTFKTKKLPLDLSLFPKFDYNVINFQSLFVAGLKDYNWELMNTALRYFSNSEAEDYRSAGLPYKYSQAEAEVNSMRISGETLNIFVKKHE